MLNIYLYFSVYIIVKWPELAVTREHHSSKRTLIALFYQYCVYFIMCFTNKEIRILIFVLVLIEIWVDNDFSMIDIHLAAKGMPSG